MSENADSRDPAVEPGQPDAAVEMATGAQQTGTPATEQARADVAPDVAGQQPAKDPDGREAMVIYDPTDGNAHVVVGKDAEGNIQTQDVRDHKEGGPFLEISHGNALETMLRNFQRQYDNPQGLNVL